MMSKTFRLEIISPTKTETASVFWIEIESPTGSFLVGANHAPIISILKKNSRLTYKVDTTEEISREIYGGMFEVTDNVARILLEQ